MEYIEEFIDLLNSPAWKTDKHFVGCGNPNSTILIVGKECAIKSDSEQYKEEYAKNFEKWCQKSDTEIKNWVDNPVLDWGIFHPRAPYKGQRFTIRGLRKTKNGEAIIGEGGTSRTWYNYQKLINLIREQGKLSSQPNTDTIDFYEDCFITELNESCRVNNKGSKKKPTEDSIRDRFDIMRATKPFWSHFKTVILACGPYADALRTDKQLSYDIFGDANIISMAEGRKVPQLSFAISNQLLKSIADQV